MAPASLNQKTALPIRGISITLFTQIASRAISFVLQGILVRKVDLSMLGIATVSFPAFSSFALYVCKEIIRKIAIRTSMTSNLTNTSISHSNQAGSSDTIPSFSSGVQSGLNICWFSLLFPTFPLICLLCFIWSVFPPAFDDCWNCGPLASGSAYRYSIALLGFAAIVESAAEPFVIFCLQNQLFVEKAAIEGCGVFLKSVVVAACVHSDLLTTTLMNVTGRQLVTLKPWFVPIHPLIAFAIGQVCYALCWCVFMIYSACRNASNNIARGHVSSSAGDNSSSKKEKKMNYQRLKNALSLLWVRKLESASMNDQPLVANTSPKKTQPASKVVEKWSIGSFLGLYIVKDHLQLASQYLVLAAEKLLLSEGEKLILMGLFRSSQWGLYSVVTNISSIILRLIFAPVEEIASVKFTSGKTSSVDSSIALLAAKKKIEYDLSNSSKVFPSSSNSKEIFRNRKRHVIQFKEVVDTSACLNTDMSVNNHPFTDSSSDFAEELHTFYGFLLFQGTIGLIGALIGPMFAASTLYILSGEKWLSPEATATFQLSCWLLFVCSINGIMESYFHARASPLWLRYCQIVHFCIWLCTIFITIGLWKNAIGIQSLIYSNIFGMLCRILFSFAFLFSEQLKKTPGAPKFARIRLLIRFVQSFLPFALIRGIVMILIIKYICVLLCRFYIPFGGLSGVISFVPTSSLA
ncbi:hypothetical protein IE077_002092, partial [Cardiosporidium cionae]